MVIGLCWPGAGFAYGEYLSFASPKERTKEKATPDRSKARNKINDLRRRQNSRVASVDPLRQLSS
ncbi:hypothetical protein EOE67_07530 [Rheinheimera riviphila]|uniref:Uncharacterized protein n=1 Tax=Rheinheimera riviphila TaxID=1834037 RepID=A0A437QZZ0_9GAMM|nr:hypothetical protein EOE67_07530 [Rheinheimera riviphila]